MEQNIVFISYKSQDRERVRPFVEYLEKELNIDCWWDQRIDVDWSKEILTKIKESKVVLGFMTESIVNTNGVLVEFQKAAVDNKLIPIKLDAIPEDYAFETVIARLNYIDLIGVDLRNESNEKNRLLEKLKNRLLLEYDDTKLSDIKPQELSNDIKKYIENADKHFLPYLLSVAVFENQSDILIQLYSTKLEEILFEAGFEWAVSCNKSLLSKSERLKLLGCEVSESTLKSFPYPIECIRFKDTGLKVKLLDFVWNEASQLRFAIVKWIECLVEDGRLPQVALLLSILAQKNFYSIYILFLKPWLGSNDELKLSCADVCMSLMTQDEKIKNFIEEIIYSSIQTEDWSENLSLDEEENKADLTDNKTETINYLAKEHFSVAIKLACGYTGMTMPRIAIETLKRVQLIVTEKTKTDQHKNRLLNSVKKRVVEFTLKAREDSYALSALKTFLGDLLDWTNSNEVNPTYIPEFVALFILNNTSPVKNHLLFIDTLLESNEDSLLLVKSIANIFNSSFASKNKDLRESAKSILAHWVNSAFENELDLSKSTVSKLFKEIYRGAKTQDDKDRILFLLAKLENYLKLGEIQNDTN